MTLFVKTFSLAMKKFPILNSTYDASSPFSFKTHDDHNISIALDSPLGLVVPHIKRVQDLSLSEIQEAIFKLRDLGTQGRLSQNELFGGTITLSNIGTIGGTYTGSYAILC
jgi:2-oxoisovalerate dehydrogenase E2 component (dihydrolipoyl transacylase)